MTTSNRFLRRSQLLPLDLSPRELIAVISLSITLPERKKNCFVISFNWHKSCTKIMLFVWSWLRLYSKKSLWHWFFGKSISSDESTFYVNVVMNQQNCRNWNTDPPVETIGNCPKVHVMDGDLINGLWFFLYWRQHHWRKLFRHVGEMFHSDSDVYILKSTGVMPFLASRPLNSYR